MPTIAQWSPNGAPAKAIVQDLLKKRGIESSQELDQFLRPSLTSLADPLQLADMQQAIDRLVDALDRKERVVVYGDYDVDGVCSTALLVDFLRRQGWLADYFIPDRRRDGYGLNTNLMERLAGQADVLVAADCGINAREAINRARALGLDVIVVDHHQVSGDLPAAVACVNPHRSDCSYPTKVPCATGVAFLLICALRRALRARGAFRDSPMPDVREYLDLVAFATVADMVPLVDMNRVLVSAGLRMLGSSRRAGVRALLEVAAVDPARATAWDLAFRIGPRINARGRVGNAKEAVELFLTEDLPRARQIAMRLDAANKERRQLELATVTEAIERAEKSSLHKSAAIVVQDERWHPGVLGLVASRLARKFDRPAVVIGEGGRGSARSVEGLNLYEAMASGAHYLASFGGHPAAAGLRIDSSKVSKFREALSTAVVQQCGEPPYVDALRPELELSFEHLELELARAIEVLGPFGQGNPEPLFVAQCLPVHHKRIVGDNHLKLVLGYPGIDGIAFGMGEHADKIVGAVDAVFCLQRNHFRGRTTVQLRIEDLRPSEAYDMA